MRLMLGLSVMRSLGKTQESTQQQAWLQVLQGKLARYQLDSRGSLVTCQAPLPATEGLARQVWETAVNQGLLGQQASYWQGRPVTLTQMKQVFQPEAAKPEENHQELREVSDQLGLLPMKFLVMQMWKANVQGSCQMLD